MGKALVVIDVQNDYFPGGKFPLWNTEETLATTVKAVHRAKEKGIPVILIQHIADSSRGIAPFFNGGTPGAELHQAVKEAATDAPVVVKAFADSFHQTCLEEVLARLGVTELLLCGMMTQNCVTHTAISKSAEKYAVTVLTDCCTTVDQMIHLIGLNALSTRVALATAAEAV
ncbi:MAG: cysteine hydrolase [Desulfuromonadales bacterium]|nr:MAG: cysteine hydrolase [Desulfuromonadales bacterium]